jgi:hypothetical protein
MEGRSLVPAFRNEPIQREALYWEHEGNRAVRVGSWKLVARRPAGAWELYDVEADRAEMRDLASEQPERVKTMTAQWEAWARRAHVLPWIWRPSYGQVASREQADREVPEWDEEAAPAQKTFRLDAGEELSRDDAPRIAGRAFTVTADITELGRDGVIVAQGGSSHGFALYLKEGKLTFAIRRGGKLGQIVATAPLPTAPLKVSAKLAKDGTVTLAANGQALGSEKLAGPLTRMPQDGLQVGQDANGAVGEYGAPFPFSGKVRGVTLEIE